MDLIAKIFVDFQVPSSNFRPMNTGTAIAAKSPT